MFLSGDGDEAGHQRQRDIERDRETERETDLVDHDDVKHRPVAGWGTLQNFWEISRPGT
jgi:hypothetical protein